jgi:hypothetical protein
MLTRLLMILIVSFILATPHLASAAGVPGPIWVSANGRHFWEDGLFVLEGF